MSRLAKVALLLITLLSAPAMSGDRTEIQILDFVSNAPYYELDISVSGADKNTEVIIFIESGNDKRLRIAQSIDGTPYIAERQSSDLWIAEFRFNSNVNAVFAVSTERRGYAGNDKIQDLQSLRRLGIESLGSINQVLELLNEFGWRPTGYTFVGNSQLKENAFSPDIKSQRNTTDICQTPVFWCQIGQYGPIGAPCWCNTPAGPSNGHLVRKQ